LRSVPRLADRHHDLTSGSLIHAVRKVSMRELTEMPDSCGARSFVCSWESGGSDAAWVRVRGELDLMSAPEFERTLAAAQAHGRMVIVDLRDLRFLDSTGLRTILEADARARDSRARLVLIRGASNIDRLFAIAGLEDHLEIIDLDPAEPPAQALLRVAGAFSES
jgi:anti-anti-sigma factor